MSEIVKKTTHKATRNYRKPFEVRGNIEAIVKKMNPKYGDGDIYSDLENVYVIASLQCEYNYKRVRLHIHYTVKEDRWTGNEKADNLYFDTDVYFPIADFLDEGKYIKTDNSGKVKKESKPINALLYGTYKDFYTCRNFTGSHTNYMLLSKGKSMKTPTPESLSSWLPMSDLQVKIDGQGNELTGKGNIGIKGYVEFTIERTDEITKTTYVDDQVIQSNTPIEPRMGNETKIESFPRCIDGVLGYGYDIRDKYADVSSCKRQVVDYKKLNEYRQICRRYKNKSESYITSGEGVTEYTSSIEKNLSVKVSAHGFGASFSNETKTSFNEEISDKTGYKYATQKDVFVDEEYIVQGCNDSGLMMSYLAPDFLDALNRLNADRLINDFGTHVVLGMQVGTRFMFNMSYRQSTHKKSTAKSFSNSTSVSYELSTGAPKQKTDDTNNSENKSNTSIAEALIKNARDWSDKQTEIIVDYLKGNTSKPNLMPKKSGIGVSGNVEYSENEKNTLMEEDQSTEITCQAYGGAANITQMIAHNNDVSLFQKWVDSCNPSNYTFADFVPGTLIPIYELVPPGYKLTAARVKAAFERYYKSHGKISPAKYKRGVKSIHFNTIGKSNTENANKSQDANVWTDEDGVYWTLRVELVNFDDGHCGYSISFKVFEDGRTANKSILLNHVTDFIVLQNGCSSMAIDTEHPALRGKTVFEADGSWKGEIHTWKDATREIENSDARKVINCDAHRVYVHLDDVGDDLDHVGIKGWIKIPWIGY